MRRAREHVRRAAEPSSTGSAARFLLLAYSVDSLLGGLWGISPMSARQNSCPRDRYCGCEGLRFGGFDLTNTGNAKPTAMTSGNDLKLPSSRCPGGSEADPRSRQPRQTTSQPKTLSIAGKFWRAKASRRVSARRPRGSCEGGMPLARLPPACASRTRAPLPVTALRTSLDCAETDAVSPLAGCFLTGNIWCFASA